MILNEPCALKFSQLVAFNFFGEEVEASVKVIIPFKQTGIFHEYSTAAYQSYCKQKCALEELVNHSKT